MKRLLASCSLAVATTFGAFSFVSAADAGPHVYALSAQNGSGETGTVVLTPQGDKTKVDVAIAGTPDGVAQPAHIHVGTCDKLDPKPKYGLTSVVGGVSSTVVDVPVATLAASPFAVNVHKSATEAGTYVACGNLAAK